MVIYAMLIVCAAVVLEMIIELLDEKKAKNIKGE